MNVRTAPQNLMLLLLGACATSRYDEATYLACIRQTESADVSIRACSQLIGNGGADAVILAKAHLARGMAFDLKGDTASALVDMNESIRLSPQHALAYANRGVALGKIRNFPAAKRDLDQAIQLDPKLSLAWRNRAVLAELQGDYMNALKDIDQAIALDGDDPIALAERCWLRGVVDRQLEPAMSDCDRALSLNPRDWNTYNSRGLVNFRLERFSRSIDDYDMAISGDPANASSYFIRGLAKRAAGLPGRGDADIARATAMDPAVVNQYASLGVAVE